MMFRCAALTAVRREHANLFAPWPDSLRSFMGRDQKAAGGVRIRMLQDRQGAED